VPVPGMHTKWLARHRGMVLACLGTPTDSSESTESTGDADPVDIPADDLDALGLRPLPREISVILADPVLRAAVGGLRQISAPVDELAGLQIRPDAILIVENKEPALAWSDTAGLVVIHSLGNHLDVLSRLPWIRHDHCWYWGDLDRHGFTLLSRARSMISRLRSLLMASGAIEAYRPLGVEEDLDRYDQPWRKPAHSPRWSSPAENTCASNKSGFSSVTPSTPLRRPGISWRLISPRSRATASRRTCAARR